MVIFHPAMKIQGRMIFLNLNHLYFLNLYLPTRNHTHAPAGK